MTIYLTLTGTILYENGKMAYVSVDPTPVTTPSGFWLEGPVSKKAHGKKVKFRIAVEPSRLVCLSYIEEVRINLEGDVEGEPIRLSKTELVYEETEAGETWVRKPQREETPEGPEEDKESPGEKDL